MEDQKAPIRRTGSSSIYPVPAPAYRQMPPYKHYHRSWLVPLFIVANIVMFIITMIINNCPKHSTNCKLGFLKRASFQPLSENPLLGPSGETLQKMGALSSVLVVNRHQGWRLLSCIWLHAGVFHLVANMLSLLFIGIRLEQEFGFVRIGIVYILSGFGGSILSAMFIGDRISVGASGALFGLLGAMLSELITNWSIYSNKVAALFTLIIIIAINLAVGILPHVDNFAHIGGFISGFLLGFVLLLRPQLGYVGGGLVGPGPAPRSKYKKYQFVLLVLALILLIAGFITSLIVLFKGVDVNKKCSWCHYLSCVPTSHWKCSNQQRSILCHYDYSKGYLTVTCDGTSRSRDWPNVFNDSDDNSYCTRSCS